MARPSVFQTSTATDPDGRAVTLKKIDEIEAQMSRQWWKGKQEAAAASAAHHAQDAMPPAPPRAPACPRCMCRCCPDEMSGGVAPAAYGPTEPMQLPSDVDAGHAHAEFAPTEMGDGMPPLPPAKTTGRSGNPQSSRSVPILGSLAQHYDAMDVGFSTSKLFALDVEDMATDPELEEAAIRFANGEMMRAPRFTWNCLAGRQSSSRSSRILGSELCFDLYRATASRTALIGRPGVSATSIR